MKQEKNLNKSPVNAVGNMYIHILCFYFCQICISLIDIPYLLFNQHGLISDWQRYILVVYIMN